MKKLLSLSLVASATILSLNASAQDLSEAIKNVDISGTAVYRYNDYQGQTNAIAKAENNYKIATSIKSKVNDDVTANTRFLVESFGMNTTTGSDANVDVKLSEVNFTYTGIANTAVTVGKQGINTAFTVARDSIGEEATGTGIVAATTAGPVTVFGAYFNQTNLDDNGQNDTGISTLDGAQDVWATGVAASFAGINLDASYIDYADTFDAYTVGLAASYKVGEVELSPYARYSALDLDTATTDNKLWKIGMGAQMGIFGAAIGYGETDKEGGVVALDGSAATGYDEHWRITLTGVKNAEVVYASANVQAMDKLNIALKYSAMDKKDAGTNDEDEVYAQFTYQMSSNFSTYLRLGQYDVDGSEKEDMGRLQVQYSF